MNPLVLVAVTAGLIGLRFARINAFLWLVAWWIAVFVGIRYGIEPPLPSSVISMFMFIVSLALLTYAMSDSERLEGTVSPIVRFIVDRKYSVPLAIVVVALPLLVAGKVYLDMSGEVQPPVTGRTIHPAPPSTISFQGKQVDLVAGDNPYRPLEHDNPEGFRRHVQNGRRVYHQNCVFCHGDDMHGAGIYAHALDPIPANFAEPTTIAMLQESYLFWRVAKGAPGLPNESTPWASAMPAWEKFLTEEEIWDVILYLYDYTGQKPRAREHHE
ncbi:MAG: cytochrome c [Candidatus Krumholzibacteriota bacterium]|nr:cytochrome c [Candidatus Krumholzibacteriota bacterium]